MKADRADGPSSIIQRRWKWSHRSKHGVWPFRLDELVTGTNIVSTVSPLVRQGVTHDGGHTPPAYAAAEIYRWSACNGIDSRPYVQLRSLRNRLLTSIRIKRGKGREKERERERERGRPGVGPREIWKIVEVVVAQARGTIECPVSKRKSWWIDPDPRPGRNIDASRPAFPRFIRRGESNWKIEREGNIYGNIVKSTQR